MSEQHRAELWQAMYPIDDDALELMIERAVDEPGVSFSADAMEKVNDAVIVWIGTRIMRRWDHTHEPPTALRIELIVGVH